MKKLSLLILIFCLFTSFSKPAITWVAIGDSITYLNEHLNETGNRVTKGYMTWVKEKLPYIDIPTRGIMEGHREALQKILKSLD